MKNSSDTNENRTRNFPACSAVPQPSAPLRAPNKSLSIWIKSGTHNTGHSGVVCGEFDTYTGENNLLLPGIEPQFASRPAVSLFLIA